MLTSVNAWMRETAEVNGRFMRAMNIAPRERGMKVVLNKSIGACFGLSPDAVERLSRCKGWERSDERTMGEAVRRARGLLRNDADLVDIVESMGAGAAAPDAELAVVDVPDASEWRISDVLGFEFVVLDGKVY